jgi:phosphoesterase RecJ-like protein
MNNFDSISALLCLIHERQTFVISSHARPDGDAIGSSVGLMHLLEAMGKDVVVAFADPIPKQFQCLSGVERIVHELPDFTADAAILLECERVERTGFAAIDAHFTINIDHHRSGRKYADFNWIDPEACAVGAMIYDLARAADVPVSKALADCLYAAVLTDTGSFNYPATTAETFELAAHLVDCGTNPNYIAQCMFFSNPVSKLRLLGAALSNLEVRDGVCWSVVTLADLERTGASVEDCEGVVNHLIAIADIEAAVLMREQPENSEFRLSLRSKGSGNVDVSAVAECFGGGGHRNASGCTLTGTAEDVTDRVLAALEAEINAASVPG